MGYGQKIPCDSMHTLQLVTQYEYQISNNAHGVPGTHSGQTNIDYMTLCQNVNTRKVSNRKGLSEHTTRRTT